MKLFEYRMKELRKSKGLSQTDLAKALNVSSSTISRYESGRRQVSFDTISLLADFFGVSETYLLGIEKDVSYELKEGNNSISEKDLEIIKEIRKHPELYGMILEDVERTISLINKKINKN